MPILYNNRDNVIPIFKMQLISKNVRISQSLYKYYFILWFQITPIVPIMIMKQKKCIAGILLLGAVCAQANNYEVTSHDGRLAVKVSVLMENCVKSIKRGCVISL